ncbi:MAG: DUF2470 domain-containing protein [Pseudomonadota bacterium]
MDAAQTSGQITARTLVRTARSGALALLDSSTGAPTTARVGLCTDTDGRPIFPVSTLSGRVEHFTREPRVSLLLVRNEHGDPLAQPRLTIDGVVEQLKDGADAHARYRYLARHPDAAQYLSFSDFSLWRLTPTRATFIEGFGKVHALRDSDLLSVYDDWPAWHAMEAGAVEHMNDDHTDANALYATVFCGAPDGDWRITGLDPDGLDLACGDDHRRLNYAAPLTQRDELRPKLVELVRDARAQLAGKA